MKNVRKFEQKIALLLKIKMVHIAILIYIYDLHCVIMFSFPPSPHQSIQKIYLQKGVIPIAIRQIDLKVWVTLCKKKIP